MEDIKFNTICDIQTSDYIRPIRFSFQQNGKRRAWDIIRSHDCLLIILYHRAKDAMVFVRQFRPAVLVNKVLNINGDITTADLSAISPLEGFTYELCAGIIDKNKDIVQIAKEEILEECGFDVDINKIERVFSSRYSVGLSGSKMTMFFAEIDDTMLVENFGGGNKDEGEMIEVIYVPVDRCLDFIYDESKEKSSSVAFAVFWFLNYRYPNLKKQVTVVPDSK